MNLKCVSAHGDSGGDFSSSGGLGHFAGAGGGIGSLSLEGENHGSSLSFDNGGHGLSGGFGLESGNEGGGSSYSGPSSYEVSDHGSSGSQGGSSGGHGNSNGGDFHHGVSIVGAGGGGDGHQGVTFDLTHHGSDGGHSGPFGGSFVASAKYEGHGGIAHKVADGDHGGYVAFDHGQYSDVLRASEDDSSGGDGGGYKWGFVPEVTEDQH